MSTETTNRHKFRIGQLVALKPSQRHPVLRDGLEYKILRLLSGEGAQCAYSVKTITESSERVVDEDDLTLPRAGLAIV